MKKLSTLRVVFATLVALALIPGTLLATTADNTTKCYNCDCFTGKWKCESGGFDGGTECTTDQDSCTVTGNCSSSSGLGSYSLSMGPGLIMQVAAVHPRAAATLYKLGAYGDCGAVSVVSWYNDEVTALDVQALIDEGTIGLEPLAPAVIYDATIEPFGGEGDLLLKVVPVQPSDLDPVFTSLLVYLAPDGLEGPYVPYSWELIS